MTFDSIYTGKGHNLTFFSLVWMSICALAEYIIELYGTWLALLRLARFSLFLPIMVITQVLLADERYQSGYALADTLSINRVFPTQPALAVADATGMTAVMLTTPTLHPTREERASVGEVRPYRMRPHQGKRTAFGNECSGLEHRDVKMNPDVKKGCTPVLFVADYPGFV